MRDNYLYALSASCERPKDNHPLILIMYWCWILSIFTLGISALLSGILASVILHKKEKYLSHIRKTHLKNINHKALFGGLALISLSASTSFSLVFIIPFFIVGVYTTWFALRGYIRYADGLNVI